MMRNRIQNTVLFLLIFAGIVRAQSDCKDVLFVANSQFEEGRIVESISTLEPCIENIKDKQEAFEGYKILAIANQLLGKTEDLDKYIKKMLSLRPDYQKYPNGDPSVFTKELKKYVVKPKIAVGLKVGASLNNVTLVQSYSTLKVEQQYKPTAGYQLGAAFYYNLNHDIALRGNVLLGGTSINHEMVNEGFWNKTYRDNLSFMNYSFGVSKYFNVLPKTKIFVGADLGVLALYSSYISVNSTNLVPESNLFNTKDALDDRKKVQPCIGILGGTSFQLERGILDVEIAYNFFLNTLVEEDTRMDDIDFIFDTQYINDDIKLGLFSLNFTYSLPVNYRINK